MPTLQAEVRPTPRVSSRPRRPARKRRIAALVTGVIAVWGAVLGLGDVLSGPPVSPRGVPSIPAVIHGDSPLTASVKHDPPGRAIAVYVSGNYEMFGAFHGMVVGAGADIYRRVDAMDARRELSEFPLTMIAPDGGALLVSDGDSARRVDLATGRERAYPLTDARSGAQLLAWSPDGRRVAFTSGKAGRPDTLALLDLDSGATTGVPHPRLARVVPHAAAFSPDGTRLAVQIERDVELLTLGGQPARRLPLPAGHSLVPNVAWSPDGAVLATTTKNEFSDGRIWLLPAVAGTAPAAARYDGELAGEFLGWSAADRVVRLTGGNPNHDHRVERELVEVSLITGEQRPLSRFSGDHTCEFGYMHCQAFDVHVASGLLPRLATRPAGDPDRGPWPASLVLLAVGSVLLVGHLTWRGVARVQRRFGIRR